MKKYVLALLQVILCVGTGWLIGWGMGRDGPVYISENVHTAALVKGKTTKVVLQCITLVTLQSGKSYCLQAVDLDGTVLDLSENEIEAVNCALNKRFCPTVEVK
jgi:hypothetical protein